MGTLELPATNNQHCHTLGMHVIAAFCMTLTSMTSADCCLCACIADGLQPVASGVRARQRATRGIMRGCGGTSGGYLDAAASLVQQHIGNLLQAFGVCCSGTAPICSFPIGTLCREYTACKMSVSIDGLTQHRLNHISRACLVVTSLPAQPHMCPESVSGTMMSRMAVMLRARPLGSHNTVHATVDPMRQE